MQKRLDKYNYKVCYNPEFIAQGDIINGMIRPDMVLIGGSPSAADKLEGIYKTLLKNNPKICKMSTTEAEITKIALNCFLTTKVSFSNLIGDIVVKAGGNPSVVLNAIGSDTRAGNKFYSGVMDMADPVYQEIIVHCHFFQIIQELKIK